MKEFVFLVLVVVVGVAANCGCLKCSKHLQAVDIPGPRGRPIKVVFQKPAPVYEDAPLETFTPVFQTPAILPSPPSAEPGRTLGYKILNYPKPLCQPIIEDCGGQRLTPTFQIPAAPSIPSPYLGNMRYTTDTVKIPTPVCTCFTCTKPTTNSGPIFEEICINSARSGNDLDLSSSTEHSRSKRDLAQHGYKFFMNMLPQYVREPLHHSIQGAHVETSKPKINVKQKIEELKLKNAVNQYERLYAPKMKIAPPSLNKFPFAKPEGLKTFGQFKFPKLSMRAKEPTKADELILLRKLKKLNGNLFSSNINDQATDFMGDLLQPSHSRQKRSVDNKPRPKRTIIFGSDEIDVPPHYEVDVVSVEDDMFEPEVEEGDFLSKLAFRRPESLASRNIIQNAVRQELDAYHKKLAREQQIKQMQENLRQTQQQSLVPHNPIFAIMTAPMKFLKHFNDVNKGGVNPVMSTLPKLVYTTKKYFRDFGKTFQKNCLNLASDVIGDFDHVDPNVVNQIASRNKRDINVEQLKRCLEGGTKTEPVVAVRSSDLVDDEQNFRKVSDDNVRKKRYVVKVVDDGDIKEHVENFLTKKFDDQLSFLKPFQNYYDKISDLFNKLSSRSNTDSSRESYYQYAPMLQQPQHTMEAPKKKLIKVRQVKPRVIIDNKGLPFMEYDGYKRPILLKRRPSTDKTPSKDTSSEDNAGKIDSIIARAKEDPEIVGNPLKDMVPRRMIKERISSLLNEIDQLEHLDAEDYDSVFEDLIKVQQIKTSIEQDWKRLLMDSEVNNISAKLGLLSKIKDLQHAKNDAVKNIADELKKNDNEFVRKMMIHSLIKLQKLQCLISNVVEDFDQHVKMKISFDTKKEIKYVDFLSELKFVYDTTRNDLVKKLCVDRDAEGQKYIEMLHKLKKILVSEDSDKYDQAAKLIWEMNNLEKLQKQTIEEMNIKLEKSNKVKKELKILFDLQKRFEDCETELDELLGNAVVKQQTKKDMREIIAGIKQRHEDIIQRAKNLVGKKIIT